MQMNTSHQRRTLILLALLGSFFLTQDSVRAQENEPAQNHAALWKVLEGEWIRYGGDYFQTKKITRGRLVFEGWTQMGEFRFRKTARLDLVHSGGITFFRESENLVEQADGRQVESTEIYQSPLKIVDDVFWEVSRGIFVDSNQEPRVTANRRTSDAGEALLIAARSGNQARVEELLTQGVDVDHRSDNSYTALGYAAGCGHLKLVEFLLKQGAGINQRARFRKTPLAVALEGGHMDVISYLVDSGADLQTRVWNGSGMVNGAVWWGHPEVTKYFLSTGLKANDASPRNGWTPLHTAVFRMLNGPQEKRARFAECAKLLLAAGADRNAANNNGVSPLSLYREAKGKDAPFLK